MNKKEEIFSVILILAAGRRSGRSTLESSSPHQHEPQITKNYITKLSPPRYSL